MLTVAGLSPLIVMMGGPLVALVVTAGMVAGAPLEFGVPAADPARTAASWSPLAHTSEPSDFVVQTFCV